MTGGSQQLRLFRRAIRDGRTLEEACAATGGIIDLAEGRLHIAADLKNPPPPEAYQLLYDPDARAAASQPNEEPTMASAATKEEQDNVEYQRPDAAKACEIYDKQIKPKLTHINTLKGDLSDPWGDLKEHARISKKDFNYVQSLADEEDDAKRDHRLLGLAGLLEKRGLRLPRDLVTMADGDDGAPIIQTEERPAMKLVGVDEEDLAEAAE